MPHKELYIDGVWYPSVTTILRAKPAPWLDAWREKWGVLAERKTLMASAIGTEFHRCVEEYIETGAYFVKNASVDGSELGGTMKRIAGMMRSFVRWAKQTNGFIDATELQVVSKTYRYSGTLDAVGIVAGKLILLDWKTAARIYDDMQLQLVAYVQAYREQTGVDIKEGLIVCVSKDKPFYKLTTKQFKLGKRQLKQFLKLREMFDNMRVVEPKTA